MTGTALAAADHLHPAPRPRLAGKNDGKRSRCLEPLVITEDVRCHAEHLDRYHSRLEEEVTSCELAEHPRGVPCAAYLLHQEDSHIQVWARWNPAGGAVRVERAGACPSEHDDEPCLLFGEHPGPCSWAVESPFDLKF
ncbi:hypothetical protein GT204_29665 [Streptomyces sp. SID4919]|uniref:hypothetical protein n=1 Tax=unclassified Streptomyces TaxID=2593676 RepID=UPI001182B018|nr:MULTISPECIES: hypothetical protein [unclassified Streptomyces]MYY12946.1 hypothetical protein [Streptomyces sp. SID4919]